MAISDAQFSEWLKRDVPRVVLCELKFGYESGGAAAEGTIYLSDRPYTTGADDTPANTSYHAVVKACPRFRRSIPWKTQGGRSALSISDLEIVNLDGAFDFLLGTILDGYECRFYLGAPVGTPGWSRSDFRLIYVAVAESVSTPDYETIAVRLKDKRLLLDREILGEMVGGSGPDSTQYLTIYWGSHFNVEAKLYDAATDKYAVLSGTGAATYDVRDKGLSLAEPDVVIMTASTPSISVDTGTEVFTKVGHGMSVNDVVAFQQDLGLGGGYVSFSPFAGVTDGQQFWVASAPSPDTFTLSATKGGASINVTGSTYLGNVDGGTEARMRVRRWYDDLANTGRIELSSTPVGRVTVDLRGLSQGGTGPYLLVKYIIETYGNVVAADVDSAAFTAADTALDAKITTGYTNYHVEVRENALDALDRLVASLFGWWGQNRIGEITCGLVDVSGISAAVADRTLVETDLLSDLAAENEPPAVGRVNVFYGLNHTVQTDGLAETVDAESLREFASRYRYTQRSSAPSGTTYAGNKPLYHKTMVEGEPSPAAEMDSTQFGNDMAISISDYANEVAADLAPQRQLIRARVPLDFYETDLGDVIEITASRFGLDDGENARVVGIDVDLTSEVIDLEMIRQFTPDYAASSFYAATQPAEPSIPDFAADTLTIGVSPVAGSSASSATYILGGRPIARSGTLTKFRIRSGTSATVKLKIFRRNGRTFTMLSEQSVSVVSGLNTFDSSLGTLTAVAVAAGDYVGIYSATANFVQFASVTAPSGTEYYSSAGDVTTTLAVTAAQLPSNNVQLQMEVTVTTAATAGVRSVGDLLYLGTAVPAAGSTPNAATNTSYYEECLWPVESLLETIEAHSTVASWCLITVLAPTAAGYELDRVFALTLSAGTKTYTAGADFPRDVLVPAGGKIGFWAMMTGLSSDSVRDKRHYHPLDATATAGCYPTTALNAFTAATYDRSAQIRFGLRRTWALTPTETRVDQTFNVIPEGFSATGWAVTAGRARNTGTGLANSCYFKRAGNFDGVVSVWATFAAATDEIAVFRRPTFSGENLGTIVTINANTDLIAIRALWDGSTSLPAVATSKTSTIAFQTGVEYQIDLAKVGTTLTVTVTDGTNTDTLSFTAKDGAGAHNLADGLAIGAPGFAAIAGTIDVSRLRFTTIAAPKIMIFGDSIVEGSGASEDADAFAYQIVAALGGDGLISPHSGITSTNIVARIERELRQFYPKHVLVLIGTNDTVTATWQTQMTAIINIIEDCGATAWIGAVPAEAADTNPELVMNPWLRANHPEKVISYDYALTTGGTGLGANRNAALYRDTLHPNDAGHAAMYAQTLADAPEIFA